MTLQALSYIKIETPVSQHKIREDIETETRKQTVIDKIYHMEQKYHVTLKNYTHPRKTSSPLSASDFGPRPPNLERFPSALKNTTQVANSTA